MAVNSDRKSGPRLLVVGIGSPHGDDQIGWIVVRQLARDNDDQISIRTAQEPSELLGWLDDVQELIVCDACRSGGAIGAVRRWEWPSDSLKTHCRPSSHDMTLPFVLALAQRLGKLPGRVTVWGIEVGDVSPGAQLSKSICNALEQIVSALADDLADARSRLEELHHA